LGGRRHDDLPCSSHRHPRRARHPAPRPGLEALAWNTGISYGWFSDSGPTGQAVLIAVKALAVVALAVWMAKSQTKLATVALGLIIGGAIGNAIDRFAWGAVVDFALLHVEISGKTYNWYVFNLADVAIVAGVAALLYDSFFIVPAAKAP
jgi:signal peptidase II